MKDMLASLPQYQEQREKVGVSTLEHPFPDIRAM
jgi:syntaxin-binding protein 1